MENTPPHKNLSWRYNVNGWLSHTQREVSYMFSRNDYLFNILVDDDADLVIMTVGGFVSDIERQEFADLLDNTLRNKKLILFRKNLSDKITVQNKSKTIH